MSDIAFRATTARPCPVCGAGSKGCSGTADGLHFCRGEPRAGWKRITRSEDGNGFRHYRREDEPRREPTPKAPPKPPRNWRADAERCARDLTDGHRAALAEELGLPVSCLTAFPLLGYLRDPKYRDCWTFPEFDASGRVTALCRRLFDPRDGEPSKPVLGGGCRGLYVPQGWRERSGPVLIPEGASDVLALTACELSAVGRPNNTGGAELLAELLRGVDREIIVLGENDQKKDTGQWPGGEGRKVAEKLAAALKRPVRFALPPGGAKDARVWVRRLAVKFKNDWPAVAREVLAELRPPSRWPRPVRVTDLADTDTATEWLWHGCFARRHVTLFSALMKCGKTTLLGHLLLALQRGEPFVGRATRKTRTLLVSEESQAIWRQRRDDLGLDEHLSVLCRPMMAKPTFADWVDFLGHVEECARFDQADLVLFDTISAFAPWKSENDSAEVMGTVTPLNRLTQAGAAVGLFHHFGKMDGSEGRASRGSTALAGAADVIIELRRFKPDDREDRRRVLNGIGRFDEIPTELVIELQSDGTSYTVEGDRKEIAARELRSVISEALPKGPPGDTTEEIHERLPAETRPRRSDLARALQAGAECRAWNRGGTGKKGAPWRFWGHET